MQILKGPVEGWYLCFITFIKRHVTYHGMTSQLIPKLADSTFCFAGLIVSFMLLTNIELFSGQKM